MTYPAGKSPISIDRLDDWAMAGHGRFKSLGSGIIESEGGPGVLWYRPEAFGDFRLRIKWRLSTPEDNSGVFLRFPPLGASDPDNDWRRAVNDGYEVQIDDRGYDPKRDVVDSPLHLTGAIYRLAPATARASRPVGDWNEFDVTVRGVEIAVALNNVPVVRLDRDVGRPAQGHIGLQNHHAGSRVQFRDLQVTRI